MLYDVFISVLTAVGITGALVFSFKIAGSPIRRIGVIRESPRTADEKLGSRRDQDVPIVFEAGIDKFLKKKGTFSHPLIDTRDTSLEPSHVMLSAVSLSDYFDAWHKLQPAGLLSSPEIVAQYLDVDYKRVHTSLGSTLIVESSEHSTTAELQGKVKDLEERLKKVESELLRESQESRTKKSEEQAKYIQ
jgi:hypothetical protein